MVEVYGWIVGGKMHIQATDGGLGNGRPETSVHTLPQNAYWTIGPTTSKTYWTFKWLLDLNDTNTEAKRERKVPEGRGVLVRAQV